MIVDPDFLDHWRTRMVVDALGGDELAPTYLLRLWAHCQTRKSDRFAMPPAGLKAQCRYQGDAMALEKALTDAGFVRREGDTLHVLGWAEQNASLLAAWENGGKGGRPPKPRENPRVQDEEPTGNPEETQGKPDANPDETDKTRLDEIGINSPTVSVDSPDGEPPKAAPTRIPCPYNSLVSAFHDECPTMPRVMKLSANRRTLLSARWKEVDQDSRFESPDDGVQIFRAIFRRAHASDFLSGRSGKFKPGFDWLMQQGNFLKLCEGNYDNRNKR